MRKRVNDSNQKDKYSCLLKPKIKITFKSTPEKVEEIKKKIQNENEGLNWDGLFNLTSIPAKFLRNFSPIFYPVRNSLIQIEKDTYEIELANLIYYFTKPRKKIDQDLGKKVYLDVKIAYNIAYHSYNLYDFLERINTLYHVLCLIPSEKLGTINNFIKSKNFVILDSLSISYNKTERLLKVDKFCNELEKIKKTYVFKEILSYALIWFKYIQLIRPKCKSAKGFEKFIEYIKSLSYSWLNYKFTILKNENNILMQHPSEILTIINSLSKQNIEKIEKATLFHWIKTYLNEKNNLVGTYSVRQILEAGLNKLKQDFENNKGIYNFDPNTIVQI